ncbi:hypothetical protein [Phaeodactylibacter xiamenensis]|uniref:hypothetical protein n=1 Tax=Phaeodactylibacter xiamenensis TaxID=1524460 RepID=UPI0024A95490|nr:hypothetical protein [Phaeodactylibacter xiamenensis]
MRTKLGNLLFGAGEYFLSRNDFRERYGLTIGTFVSEALLALKKTDREKIKVFFQGSADFVGQATFSGNLDDNYLYIVLQKAGAHPPRRQCQSREG